MPEITLYRQVRRDGGKRTGIDVGGWTAFSRFEEGESDLDPALAWFVDVRCSGPGLPQERDAVRDWFLRHGEAISAAMNRAADSAPVGYDLEQWPLQFSEQVDGVDVVIVCSAVRRIEARQVAQILRDFASHLRDYVTSLDARPAA